MKTIKVKGHLVFIDKICSIECRVDSSDKEITYCLNMVAPYTIYVSEKEDGFSEVNEIWLNFKEV